MAARIPALLLLACACLAVLASGAAARSGRVLIVLGDSHSDNGNAWRASNHTIPSPAQGFYNGRYTDGPNWNDYIANMTGVSIFNTAYPAATACQPPLDLPFPFHIPYLAQQAEAVANASASLPTNRAIFIWMGTNDIYIAMRGVLAGALPFEVLQNMLLPTYAACLKQSAEALVRYGHTKSLVVANVHPMQITPVWTAAAEQIPLPDGGVELKHNISLLVRSLNDMIRRDVADLAARYKRAKISMFDMSGFFFTTANEGSLVGITNVMDACNVVTPWDSVAGFPGNNVTSMCPNPSNYMYANVEHLSSHAQMLLAEAIQGHLAAQSPELFA